MTRTVIYETPDVEVSDVMSLSLDDDGTNATLFDGSRVTLSPSQLEKAAQKLRSADAWSNLWKNRERA